MGHWLSRLAAKVRGGRHRPSSAPRRACLSIEALEEREMLSASPQAVSASSRAAAAVSAEGDPGTRVASTLPESPRAAAREGTGDPELCSPRPSAANAAACLFLEDLCPAPFSGAIFLSLTAGPAALSLSAGGTGQGRPSPAAAPPGGTGLGEDLGGDVPSPGTDLDPAGDSSPRRAAPDNDSLLDRHAEAEPAPAVGARGRASIFDVLDDDSDTDDIEEVFDLFAEAAESDGSSENVWLAAQAHSGAAVVGW
jgi:hypothetical protein